MAQIANLSEIISIKKKYNDLIERRIEDCKLPPELRSMTLTKFLHEEKRLNNLGIKARYAIGINPLAGEGVLCRECVKLFPGVFFKDKSRESVEKCSEHVNVRAIK